VDSKKIGRPGWVIWFVGLPGAGKSTYAQAVYKVLSKRGEHVCYLSMDEWRRVHVSEPRYSRQERVHVYKLFAGEAVRISGQGKNVIMDGTAPELSMREYARGLIERFAEIYVRCPLETAMRRETNRPQGLVMADLYRKAIKRKQTGEYFKGVGDIIGVDTPFEENPEAECMIDSDSMSVEQGQDLVLDFLASWHGG